MSGQRAARWTARVRAGLTMAALAAAAAVISYSDGLFLVREAGAAGRVDYLYPLLPDGLIVICLIDLYGASRAQVRRPGWATAGLILGACLTVAMNLAAGLARSPLLALIDALVPVMFFVAAEVLNGHIRRGRGAPSPGFSRVAPATPGHDEPPTAGEALSVLLATGSQRELAAALGVSKYRVQAWAAMTRQAADPPAATQNGQAGGG